MGFNIYANIVIKTKNSNITSKKFLLSFQKIVYFQRRMPQINKQQLSSVDQ